MWWGKVGGWAKGRCTYIWNVAKQLTIGLRPLLWELSCSAIHSFVTSLTPSLLQSSLASLLKRFLIAGHLLPIQGSTWLIKRDVLQRSRIPQNLEDKNIDTASLQWHLHAREMRFACWFRNRSIIYTCCRGKMRSEVHLASEYFGNDILVRWRNDLECRFK